MTKTQKKYIISSLITFASAFSLAILPFLDSFEVVDLKKGAVVSLVFTGLRAGVKAIIEYVFVSKSLK